MQKRHDMQRVLQPILQLGAMVNKVTAWSRLMAGHAKKEDISGKNSKNIRKKWKTLIKRIDIF